MPDVGWRNAARATGVVGWDEMRFNMTAANLADPRAGRPLRNALELWRRKAL